MDQTAFLDNLVSAVGKGGDAAEFLASAFLSYYHGGENKVDLREIRVLDRGNFSLFTQMLTLRKSPGWSDDLLFQTAQRIRNIVRAGQ